MTTGDCCCSMTSSIPSSARACSMRFRSHPTSSSISPSRGIVPTPGPSRASRATWPLDCAVPWRRHRSPKRTVTHRAPPSPRPPSTHPTCVDASRCRSCKTSWSDRHRRGSPRECRARGCERSRTWSTRRISSCSNSDNRRTPTTPSTSPDGRFALDGHDPVRRS